MCWERRVEPRQIHGENWMKRYAKETSKSSNMLRSKVQHTFTGPDVWLGVHSVLDVWVCNVRKAEQPEPLRWPNTC